MASLSVVNPDLFNSEKFKNASCIVVKIGSALLIDEKSNSLKEEWLRSLVSDVSDLKSEGKKIVIVSSGSIPMGKQILNLNVDSLSLEDSQAAAAVGQIYLAQCYQKFLADYNIIAAQILVTAEDSRDRRRYLNGRATLLKLLEMGVVPIVNENDTVATDEIRFGDNDRLAAQVSSLCDADVLVLLSDVNGLYTGNPNVDKNASLIPIVENINLQIEAMANDYKTSLSKGGMKTKIEAARAAVSAGCHMVITNGKVSNPLSKLRKGGLSTWFVSSGDPIKARKQWIFNTKPNGKIYVDSGAEKALLKGKSLLPAGVLACDGLFKRGDTVSILSSEGRPLANGLVGYNNQEVDSISGCHSSKISTILGHPGRAVLVHRNDMAINEYFRDKELLQ